MVKVYLKQETSGRNASWLVYLATNQEVGQVLQAEKNGRPVFSAYLGAFRLDGIFTSADQAGKAIGKAWSKRQNKEG